MSYLARGWVSLASLVFVPLYINLLGIEAYGLVGFYLILLAVTFVWALGPSTTLLVVLAQATAAQRSAEEMRDAVRTLETIYWGATAVVGTATILASGYIAQWVRAESLSHADVRAAIALMGIALVCQGPLTLYQGGLQGLDRQVTMNKILAAGATLRGVGAVLVLWLVSPSVAAFFVTQAVISLLQTSAMATALWRALPPSPRRSRFRREMVASTWRFTAGTTAISVTAVVLTQTDKVLVSGILPLREFAYYSLASQVAAGLLLLVSPLSAAVFPRLSALAAAPGRRDDLAALYNRACQVVAIVVLPTAAVLAAFSTQLLLIWTASAQTAAGADTIMSILLIGSALNGLCFLPFALQLAHGWTRLALAQNLITIAVLIPAVVAAALSYGAVGAAAMWPIVNLGYVTVLVGLMHRRILPAQRSQWYRRNLLAPLLAVSAVVVVGRLAEPALHPAWQLAWISCVFVGAVAAAVAATGSASWFLPRVARSLPVVGRA